MCENLADARPGPKMVLPTPPLTPPCFETGGQGIRRLLLASGDTGFEQRLPLPNPDLRLGNGQNLAWWSKMLATEVTEITEGGIANAFGHGLPSAP